MLTQGKVTRDKHRINSIIDISYILKQDSLLVKLGIHYPSYRDLLAIYHNYVNTDTGLKVYQLTKLFGYAPTNYRPIFQRLNVLKDKGLIQSVNGSYIPTDKTIQLLNSIKV